MNRFFSCLVTALLVLVVGCGHQSGEAPPFTEQPPAPVQSDTPGTEQPTPTTDGASAEPPPLTVSPAPAEPPPLTTTAGPAEQPVPPTGLRADLLLALQPNGQRDAIEIFSYEISTDNLVALTQAGETGLRAPRAYPAPDGKHFAYLRYRPMSTTPAGICVASLEGGAPRCFWGEVGSHLAWRPGSLELLVWDSGPGQAALLKADGGALNASRLPMRINPMAQFSPDGRWLWYTDKGQYMTPAEAVGPVMVSGQTPFWAQWIDADRLLVLEKEDGRLGTLLIVGADGKATRIGRAFEAKEQRGNDISKALPDDQGRYIAVNFGIAGSTFQRMGAALYDLKQGTWLQLPHAGVPAAVGWTGAGRLLLSTETGYLTHDPVTGNGQPLNYQPHGDYLGSSADGDWLVFYTPSTGEMELVQVSTGEHRSVTLDGYRVSAITMVQGQ